ncbi:MAG: hypothetical protein MZV70_05825 [Desulfobacterales bacterium]|nr:hypothetical protein [Desulfobacterales bacterium]
MTHDHLPPRLRDPFEFPVPEYRGRGVHLRHRETGCEVFHLRSEDEENTFAFCFRTPQFGRHGGRPHRGAFRALRLRALPRQGRLHLPGPRHPGHLPERPHLPGQDRVPRGLHRGGGLLQPPGRVRRRRVPAPDHPGYLPPGSPPPGIRRGREARTQGVVYNEMRGDYSSPDSLIATRTYQTLFSPGHPYHADSGGDPDEIPSLTYEAFRAFWEGRYHPSNCRIFLHGSIPTERQLGLLRRAVPFRIRPARAGHGYPPPAPVRVADPGFLPLPGGGGHGGADDHPGLLADRPSRGERGQPDPGSPGRGSPGQRRSAPGAGPHGIRPGEDLSPHSGLDTGLRQALFSAGLRGVERGREAEIEDLILRTLGSLVRDGIPGDLLDAAFHSIEFSSREIRRGGGTYWPPAALPFPSGLASRKAPGADPLLRNPLGELKARMAEHPRYLEEKLREWILDNPHRATVTVYPDPALAETQRTERRAALDALERSLTDSDRAGIREIARALRDSQDSPDGRGARDSIPMLKRSDIPREIEVIPRQPASLGGTPASLASGLHKRNRVRGLRLPSCGPSGGQPTLPAAPGPVRVGCGLSGPVLRRGVPGAGKKGRGFHVLLQTSTPAGSPRESPSAWIVFRLKALERNFPAALDLARGLMTEPDFGTGSACPTSWPNWPTT